MSVNDELAEVLNISLPRGVLVAFVDENGPAKVAGIQNGDVFLKFDGHDIKETDDLLRMVSKAVGETHIDTIGWRK